MAVTVKHGKPIAPLPVEYIEVGDTFGDKLCFEPGSMPGERLVAFVVSSGRESRRVLVDAGDVARLADALNDWLRS